MALDEEEKLRIKREYLEYELAWRKLAYQRQRERWKRKELDRIRAAEQARIEANTRTYNYSPFAIIKTDHETFMSIEALEHEDNTYHCGIKTMQYNKKRFFSWVETFDYLRRYKYSAGIIVHKSYCMPAVWVK